MNNALLRSPDHVSRIALFGARFVDVATGRGVSDGLTITVYPEKRPDQRRDAFCNPSGVFALQRVPGLDRLNPQDPADPVLPLDLRVGDQSFWSSAIAAAAPYVVEVRDHQERFLPVAYVTSIPTPGPYGTGTDPTGLPAPRTLFSAPARTAPPALGVIRCELRMRATAPETKDMPLAYALLIVEIGTTERHLGIADASGRVVVMFNLPEPPASPGQPVKPFVWPVRISVHYRTPPSAPPDPREALPDLDDLLGQDGTPIKILPDLTSGSAPVERIDAELHFGRELVLRTGGSSFLFASPA